MSRGRIAFLMILSAALGAAGHFFWNTYTTVENAKKAQVEDSAAMAQLDKDMYGTVEGVAGINQEEAARANQDRADKLERIKKEYLNDKADVLDSKVFEDKAACDATVRKVAGEYSRRGISSTDMVETSPFPGSTGLVVMLRNDKYLYYAGCVTNNQMDWAAYIHFKPNGK